MKVFDSKKHKVLMIYMNSAEALQTIKSLTQQLISKSSNNGRYEKYLDEDGRDFSIAVSDERE